MEGGGTKAETSVKRVGTFLSSRVVTWECGCLRVEERRGGAERGGSGESGDRHGGLVVGHRRALIEREGLAVRLGGVGQDGGGQLSEVAVLSGPLNGRGDQVRGTGARLTLLHHI